MPKLKEKERTTILNALKGGVVPPVGLRYIQVGRVAELGEVVRDLDHISTGGSTVRFIVGDFGAGKSFFLTLAKLMAHEKKMVVLTADVTVSKILSGSDGKSRALLTELISNMSTRSRPEGNALRTIVETWIDSLMTAGGDLTESGFYRALAPISSYPLSQDFAKVLFRYFEAFRANDTAISDRCVKWLRAEYETKTEAKRDLGVSRIIEDSDFYDVLKLYAGFCVLAGFSGTLVNIDELAVLVRQRDQTRKKNYETLLTILNDCLQGTAKNLGFLFGSTSEALSNKERGLYSYGALETRLMESRFARGEIKDFSGPVIRLAPLTQEQIFVLLTYLREIYNNQDPSKPNLSEEGIKAFFSHIYSAVGAAAHLNPRDVTREFIQLLSVMESNPGKVWSDFLKDVPAPKSAKEELLVNLDEV